MDATASNRAAVAAFCALFARGDVDDVLAAMTDDATWWVNGKPHLFADAGTRTKAEMATAWRAMFADLDGGFRIEVTGIVAEGDRVAVEARSHAVTRAGRVYANDFHFLFRLRDGKVAAVREYMDPMHAREVFG